MEAQVTTQQIKEKRSPKIASQETDYPQEPIVNVRLPRKRIALLSIDIDLSALPKRKPHIVPELEVEEAE